MDEEHIYPYWRDLIPIKYKGAAIPFSNMIHLCSIPVEPAIALELFKYEASGKNNLAAVCGRYYEALFQSRPDITNTIGSLIEGAPVDGQLENPPDGYYGGGLEAPWQINQYSELAPYWEMKKLRLSTGNCHFDDQNISALIAFQGICIGATIYLDGNKVIYRYCRPPAIPK